MSPQPDTCHASSTSTIDCAHLPLPCCMHPNVLCHPARTDRSKKMTGLSECAQGCRRGHRLRHFHNTSRDVVPVHCDIYVHQVGIV